ncbi:MAG TPA: adenylate/guanylate cyclase domain-containing protein [Solirubrobacteraceae bacterium]|nr:adenylate/guanylate cyclase domain-containing protein [Solirubrobacteraceae bacterium]
MLLEAADLLSRAELATVNTRFAVRGERPAPRDVIVVGIDDVTFSELRERFPFSRRTFARALARIADDRPRAIAYDVQFTEASDDPEADNELVLAIRRAGNVILSTTEVGANAKTNILGGAEAQKFARATPGNGLLPEDSAGALRRVPYAVDGLRALSVATVERAGRRVDRRRLSGDGAWIDYSGPPGHMRSVSFSRAVRGRFAPGTFRGKIVIIGGVAPSLQDRHPTSWPAGEMAGPEIHANAVSTLLRGAALHASSGLADALLALALALLAPLLGLRLRPLTALAVSAAVGLLFLVVVQLAFGADLILPLVVPLIGLAVGFLGALLVHWLTATFERAQTRDLFARFVPDSVVAQVLDRADDEEDVRLGGELLQATVLFSDLRGFTSFAEGREPGQVIGVLNHYLTQMSDAILDQGGTLVAYMGDGIMAVFGAPLPADDHAERALAAARDMLERLERFNAWMREDGHGDGFKMGIGLNTGDVMSGNVGSARRLEYTAIGDTTNTAARLEAMTKGTPYQLFVADGTRAQLSEPPADLECLDELEVPGRKGGMKVWALRSSATVRADVNAAARQPAS